MTTVAGSPHCQGARRDEPTLGATRAPAALSRRRALAAAIALPWVVGSAGPAHARDADAGPLDAQARWLAGMTPLAGSEASDEWTTYARSEEERWRLAEPRRKAMTDWASREIRPLVSPEQALFYPFAGPDALHAIALFGWARRALLVGLEPVGALPDPTTVPRGYFPRLGAALSDVFRLTFFRTKEMSSDFEREGILAALVVTIVRLGGRLTSVRTSSKPDAVRIDWRDAEGEERRLDYVRMDLSNTTLSAHPRFVERIGGNRPVVTFVKAAMYLLAEPRFSLLRQRILEESGVVVQDDTGIPLRHFDQRWALRFFGRYEEPVAPFADRAQPDLRAAFARRAVSAVPFGIGYHVRPDRSNLMIASKGAGDGGRR